APPTRRAARTAPAPRPRRTPRPAPRASRRAETPAPSAPAGTPRRSRGLREHDRPNPRLLLEEPSAELESLLALRAMAGDDVAQLVPVGLRVLPDAVVPPAELRIGKLEPELEDLRDVPLEELLARVLVPLALDAPDVHRILIRRDRVAVELHQWPPPAVDRLLHELALRVGAGHHRQDHVAAVEDVERLLPADLLHDPRVRRVGALQQRLLADDRRRVDEPGNRADVAPGPRRVVEHV